MSGPTSERAATSGIEDERASRLQQVMGAEGVEAVLTADPINIFYATGVRNMTVFSMMGAARFAMVVAGGPTVVWEFAGCEHLADSPVVDEIRIAPGVTPMAGPAYPTAIDAWVDEVADLLDEHGVRRLAVERFELPVLDALRRRGVELSPATDVFLTARVEKTPAEIQAIRHAVAVVERAVQRSRAELQPGRTEVEVWGEFHRSLIADNGEYVSTRLVQSGSRTFPYFNEAGTTAVGAGDLFCIDTDAVGPGGYGADFSRTYVCGDVAPTGVQRTLFGRAVDQLQHNAALIEPGRTFESFARSAWVVPERHAPYGYYCLAHGLGMTGEAPYIPVHAGFGEYPLPGRFLPGMVICVESYIGCPDAGQGAKVEDQYLVTETGAELLSTLPHEL